jgi:hypothetical protein
MELSGILLQGSGSYRKIVSLKNAIITVDQMIIIAQALGLDGRLT